MIIALTSHRFVGFPEPCALRPPSPLRDASGDDPTQYPGGPLMLTGMRSLPQSKATVPLCIKKTNVLRFVAKPLC